MSPKQSEAVITAYQNFALELQEAIDEHLDELGEIVSADPEKLSEEEKAIIYPASNAWHKMNQAKISIRGEYTQQLYDLLLKDINDTSGTD